MLCCSQRKHGADAADASGTSSSLLLEHLSKQLLLLSSSTARAGQEPGQDPRGETFPLSLPGAPLTTASREGLLSAVAHLLHQTIFSVYPACQELRAEISAGFGIIQCILLVVIWASVLLSASPVCAGQLTVGKHLQEGWALLAALHLLIHIWPGCLHVALCSENRRPASPRNRNYRNAV